MSDLFNADDEDSDEDENKNEEEMGLTKQIDPNKLPPDFVKPI